MELPEGLTNPQGETILTKNGIIKLPTSEQQISDLCNYVTNLYECISFISAHQEIIYQRLNQTEEKLKIVMKKQNRFMK